MFDSIILDIDGTLWDTTGLVAEAWNKAILENFPSVPLVTADILKKEFGKTMKLIADNLFIGLNEDEKLELMEACCKSEDEALVKNTKDISYAGLLDTIKILSKKVKLFIVSNCHNGYIELVMDKNNLASYITDYECYGHTLLEKWQNIQLIIDRNNLENPVYVGDTQGDLDSCKKINIPFIYASYGFGKVCEYYKKINSFPELLELIK